MKKLLAIFIALILLLSLCACGAESAVSPAPDTTEGSKEVIIQTEAITESTEAAVTPVAFEEITVVDNDACLVKITGIEPDDFWGYALKVYLENKSADKTFMYSVTTASINDVMADPMFATEVAPGKKSNETVSFMTAELENHSIGDFTDISLNFRVSDSEDWMADPVAVSNVHVYPYGEEKAVSYVREAQSTDTVLVDNDAVTIIATGYDPENIWGYTVNLFIVNKTDTTIMLAADEASVNGFMLDPFYATSVDAGKCAFSDISWFESDFEENGIADVENIEFTLRVYNEEDWSDEDFANELITLTP